ncbi:signal transduction histidine kinase LytS [Flammeovirgaceae bacterium 311]|nr:signal transduction histidine kinase LytS [Flammeovirgaceae bacterium 311]
MERIKKVFFLIHLFGWILLFLFLCWVFWSEGHANWLYLAGILILSSLSVFYSHFFILTRFWNSRKFGLYLLGLTLVLLLGPLPFLLAYKGEINDWSTFLDQFFTTLFSIVIIFVILSWVARAIENWVINEFKRERLEKQAAQAELSYLKWQINPHFLFNTLNNIHTLSFKNSPATPEAIMRLSSMMRYMLYEANADTVALNREIEYLQDFISLQQLRYKKTSIVDFVVVGDTDSCQIAPLLFIHFLENAYKHSPARLNEGDIRLSIEIKENSLIFSIQNPTGDGKAAAIQEVGGIGLTNVKKRLQLLYPGQHVFEVSSSEEFFKVVLKIHPLHLQNHERKTDMLYSG